MDWKSLQELAADIQSGRTTAVELVEKCLERIEAAADYNALISVNEAARKQAEAIDRRIAAGELTDTLAGIPYIAKDNFLTNGHITTAASNILINFNPPFNATAIQRLENAGAIMIAKANLDSFAHGSSTENSDMGPTLNPHDKTRVPGGSSGGSAAAVVLGLAPFALGTDTGGSIRLPASFTGSVGFKPTYGLISRYGVVAMASSTDVIGPICARVEDVAVVLDCIAARDRLDSTTIERDAAPYTKLNEQALKGKKLGVVKEFYGEGVDKQVRQAVDTAIQQAKSAGATVQEISIPEVSHALAVYYIIMPAEVSSNLSRYDGIRYGHSAQGDSLNAVYEQSRTEGFNDEVKRRIMIGTYVLSSGYYDAYYKKAQAVRTLLIQQFASAFEEVDYLISPTAPSTAFKLGENTGDPLQMYLSDVMTVAANLVGCAAISIPCGSDKLSLPIGLQVMAPQRHDRDLIAMALHWESQLAASHE